MLGHPAAQRLAKLLRRRLDPAMRQPGQCVGIAFTGNQGFDHRPPAQIQDIGERRIELDVGIFQRLLEPLDVAASLAHELLAGSQQSAQFLV